MAIKRATRHKKLRRLRQGTLGRARSANEARAQQHGVEFPSVTSDSPPPPKPGDLGAAAAVTKWRAR
jgi:hypothetical protein